MALQNTNPIQEKYHAIPPKHETENWKKDIYFLANDTIE